MEITAERIHGIDYADNSYAFTVHIENQRILTIATYSSTIASKWIKDALKSNCSKSGKLLVGVSVAKNDIFDTYCYNLRWNEYGEYDEIIQLSIGSHCLLYHLKTDNSKFLIDFFNYYNVVAAGIGMVNVAKKLQNKYGIVVKNPVDLGKLATKERKDLYEYDLYRCDVDRLAKLVLGKHMDVIRPEKKKEKYSKERSNYRYSCYRSITSEKVKYATVDCYLCFLIGEKLHGNEGY